MQGIYEAAMMGAHPGWEVLQQHIARNVPEYITFVGALAIAAVCTMPEKCVFIVGEINTGWKLLVQQLWSWMRNTLQTAVPAAQANHPKPTPPADQQAQPK